MRENLLGARRRASTVEQDHEEERVHAVCLFVCLSVCRHCDEFIRLAKNKLTRLVTQTESQLSFVGTTVEGHTRSSEVTRTI